MNRPVVRGQLRDAQTRCRHWHSPLDIIAIRMACCGEYYACYQCHEEEAGHAPAVWPASAFDRVAAVLCGACGHEMTVRAYTTAGSACPRCEAGFNPRCSLHWPLYFAADES